MASITITTTAQMDARVAPAFGHLLDLPGSANSAQVKQALVAYIRSVVYAYERDLKARESIPEINPT